MAYTIPVAGNPGDPGFLAAWTAIRAAVLDLDTRVTALEGGGGSTFVGAFDSLATPHRALSVRRLLSAYTGPLLRVRRSSDNTEQDISYDSAGDLDTAALLAFAGSGSAYIVTWYDQAGSARNVTQPTTGAQPRIVNAGALDVLNTKPSIVFDGTDDHLFSTVAGLYAAGAASLGFVFSGASASNATTVSESKSTNAGALYRLLRSSTANANVQGTNEAGTSMWASTASGSNIFDSAQHHYFYADSGSAISTRKDNTAVHAAIAATRSGTLVPDRFALGAHVGTTVANFFTGRMQEVVTWATDRTADRAAILTAQKPYFGTP